jgi:prepilin-type N-terminal cleavage/methylation domain-containing protein
MKKTHAFTLIETMIALLIASGVLFWAARMQVGSLNRIVQWRADMDRIFLVKKYLYTFFLKPPSNLTKPKIKKLEQPQTKIITQYQEIPRKSSLYPWRKSIRRVDSTAQWTEGPFGRRELYSLNMVTFVVAPPPKEKSHE